MEREAGSVGVDDVGELSVAAVIEDEVALEVVIVLDDVFFADCPARSLVVLSRRVVVQGNSTSTRSTLKERAHLRYVIFAVSSVLHHPRMRS